MGGEGIYEVVFSRYAWILPVNCELSDHSKNNDREVKSDST